MWYKAQMVGSLQPPEIDNFSSQEYVYIRKNIQQIETENEEDPTTWEYDEQKIRKEDWELYQNIITNTNDITDVQLALCDLYEMIGG